MRMSTRQAIAWVVVGSILIVFAAASIFVFGDKPYIVVPLGIVGVLAIFWSIPNLRRRGGD
jgi:hypothetical protein